MLTELNNVDTKPEELSLSGENASFDIGRAFFPYNEISTIRSLNIKDVFTQFKNSSIFVSAFKRC